MAPPIKKPLAKKPVAAPAKKPGTALVPWEKQMAEAAQKQAGAEKVFGSFSAISIRGGVLSVDENAVPGNEMDVVVLVTAHENQYYPGAFDPNKPQSPDCYAFGEVDAENPEDGMAPHAEVDEEKKQGDDNGLCANCWANQMASADVGRGKACKNVRRLALITADGMESPEALLEAEVRMLKVPVMSVKNWATYVRNQLAEELQRPYWGVVTKIKVVPDPKSQFKVQFHFVELINFDQELFDALQKRISEVKGTIVAPYPKLDPDAAPPQRGGRGGAPQRMAPPVSRRPLPNTVPINKGKPPAKTAPAKQAAPAVRVPPGAKKVSKY